MAFTFRFPSPPSPFPTQFPPPPRSPLVRAIRRQTRSALQEWKEYEEALRRKDLASALGFLQSLETQQQNNPVELPTRPGFGRELGFVGWERDWEVLDTCLNADNMKLVGKAYGFLKDRGFLPHFGKYRNIVMEGTRDVTPTVLKTSTGVEASQFAPKKWGLSGSSSPVLFAFLGGLSVLLYQGIDIRPNLTVLLGLAFMDSIFLGGCCLAQISSYWPPNRRRILIHEAGHLLTAYLMGCPIRGVILDPIVAVQMGIQGQAGTQFWDEKMASDLADGRLDGSAFDRWVGNETAGTAWCFLQALPPKLLFMVKQRVEKMMKIYSGESVFSCNLRCLLLRCQIKQDGHYYNLTICSNGIKTHTELLLKL